MRDLCLIKNVFFFLCSSERHQPSKVKRRVEIHVHQFRIYINE